MWKVLPLIFLLAGCSDRRPAEAPSAGSGYVDSSQCASCHTDIAETYRHTGMARSFYRPIAENTVEDYKTKNTFYHAVSDRHYTMLERDGRYFQRRHQLGSDGKPINVVEESADYVIGSGNHVRTYLHLNAQKKLVELPIAWYSEKGGHWGMNPGYDWQHHSDFRRKITFECMFCHNAYPESKSESDRADMEALMPGKIPEGIDCQRCHGPGGEHVRSPNAGNIVNPARLSSERNLEVCMQCHLETTSAPLPYAVRRFDRGVFSYQAGQALADYMIHFDHAAGAGFDDKFEIASSAYRLRKSRCFLESAGAMTCTTCHNPHNIPRGEPATQHYTAVCQKCHQTPARNHTAAKDCIGCHMPQRRTDDVVHAVMTDHYIQRTRPSRDLLAPLAEHHAANEPIYQGEVALYYPSTLEDSPENELYRAVAQVIARSNLQDGVPRLAAAIAKLQPKAGGFYFELAKVSSDEAAIPLYEKALERMPDFWPALHRFGLTLSRAGQTGRAVELLKQAGNRSREGTVLNDLALVYRRTGKTAEAVDALKRSVALDPGLPHVYNNLGGLLLDSGDLKGAEDAFREAIRVQPDLAVTHTNLANLLLKKGDLSQAQFHFDKAIQQASPGETSLIDSHLALANIMEMQGRLDKAVAHYSEVLKSDANFAKAHYGLGSLLVMQGKRADALRHFQLAAESSDSQTRQSSLAAIRALTRQ